MGIETLAPICLFVFKRVDLTKQVIGSLQKNNLAAQSDLHIFSDSWAKPEDESSVTEVRQFISGNIEGFKSVTLHLSETNKGLANSVIGGVSEIVNRHGKVIVLEDDLVVSDNFLDFMNEALEFYQTDEQVFSVCGYTVPIHTSEKLDVYFTMRGSSWGWGTWKNRWEKIDWNISDFERFKRDSEARRRFNRNGSDMTHLLEQQMSGQRNSWAIRWTYNQFKMNAYTVFPIISKVCNEGFGGKATHTTRIYKDRFTTYLDDTGKRTFNFKRPYIDQKIFKQFTETYSLKTRIKYKLIGLFS